jgi:type II secretory pathway pseudopilin PulG
MENRAKFLIIGLIGFLLLSVIVSLQTYTTKLNLQKEKDKLAADIQTLTQKVDKTQQENKLLGDKFAVLNKDLEKLNKEKEDFQKKFDLLNREKSELIDRLKNQKSAAATQEAASAGSAPSVPSGKDEAYWAGVLKAKTDLEIQLTTLRSELKTASINNEQIQREKNALQLDLTTFTREKEDLQRQVEYNKKLLDSIAQELVREKNDKIQIQESIKMLKGENEVLIRQVKSLSNRRYSLEQKVQELQEGKFAIERRFNDMEDKLSQKVSMVDGLKDELEVIRSGASAAQVPERQETASVNKGPVELPPIVVRPTGSTESQVRIQEGTTVAGGKVLAINRESNFVIIDLGEDAGVRIGDAFKVNRVDKTIALLEVIQTRKNISACDIKNEIVPVKIGDIVR